MKKRHDMILRLALWILVLTLLSGGPGSRASAAGTDIMFSDPSVLVGGSVTVNVYSTAAVAGIDLTLVYDTDRLNYTGWSGGLGNTAVQPGTGSLHIVDYCGSGEGRFSLNLTFTALNQGSASVRPTACSASDAGGDEMSVEYMSHSSVVTITAASSNCDLAALYIDPGALSPAFSSAVTDYSVTVPNSAGWLAVTPVKSDEAASYVVRGNDWLNVGMNTVTVTVTAGNGAQKVYTLAVTRLAAETAPASAAPVRSAAPAPTETPAPEPDESPDASPSASPSAAPTASPTPSPTASPTAKPTPSPTPASNGELEQLWEENEELRYLVKVLAVAAGAFFLTAAVLGTAMVRALTSRKSRNRDR